MSIVLLKLLLAPILLGTVSAAGRVWGASISGVLISLPIIAGPILFIISLEQGETFAAKASIGSLLGVISVTVFCLSYCHLARLFNVTISLIVSVSIALMLTLVLMQFELAPLMSFLLVTLILIAAFKLLPHAIDSTATAQPNNREIYLRMLAATLLVVIVTTLANLFGPFLSGMLATFPLASLILISFTHYYHGTDSVINTIRGVYFGLFGFSLFFLILACGLDSLGLSKTFALATIAVLLMQTTCIYLLKKSVLQ